MRQQTGSRNVQSCWVTCLVTLVLQRHAHSMPQARRDLRGVRTSSEMFIALESVVARSCAASLRLEQQWTSDASEWPGPSSAARRSWMRCAGVHAVACRSAHSPRRTGRAAEQHTAQSPGHALFRVGGNLAGAAHAAVGGRAGAGAGRPRELCPACSPSLARRPRVLASATCAAHTTAESDTKAIWAISQSAV